MSADLELYAESLKIEWTRKPGFIEHLQLYGHHRYEADTLSHVSLVNPWDTSTSRKSFSASPIGSKIVFVWFGLCIVVAVIGTTLTASVPQTRAHVLLAKSQ